ncbi:MAG: apolipoprotein N-acyltransferase [Burkholderiales bacterium]|nr:apolipoprotein N-acyltransferase [Burkholderiales bacterium]
MRGSFVWPLLAAALAGLAQAASIAWPVGGQPLWWLQLASLAVLARLLVGQASAWRGFALGQAFGTAWLCGTFWWLFISMHTYGGLAAPLAAVAVLGLAAFLTLYYAAACAAFVRYLPHGRLSRASLFASLWLLAELLRGHWFTGFPWGAGGYAHVDGPLAGLAPWLGVYGIGMVAASAAFALADAARRRPSGRDLTAAAAAIAVLAALPWLPAPRGEDSGRLQVALLQGNIPQNEKFQPGSGVPLALQWYAEALRWASAPLVVAPETALPLLPRSLPEGYWQSLVDVFATGERAALIGVPLGDRSEGYFNSVVGLKPGAAGPTPYRYDKQHLVPFGEFVPPMFRWFTSLMDIPLGDFGRGAPVQPAFEWQGQRLVPNICYEDLFGEEIGAYFLDAAKAPTVLVNASNIGWFGDTVAIDQHLAISRMRAIEFARPMLRATNTGATAIIDHTGNVTHLFPRHTRGVLVGEVEGRTGVTPYGWWVSRVGLVPLWALGLLPILLAVAVRHRRRDVLR